MRGTPAFAFPLWEGEVRAIRWGRSAYETDAALALEAEGLRALGLRWSLHTGELPELQGARVLVVTSKVRLDRTALRRFPASLELVLTTTSGVDHIDLEACARSGLRVGRLPLARRDAVVEHVLAELLHHLRRLAPLQVAARRGEWARGRLPELAPVAIAGSTVAVVGLGVIGKRLAELLQAMGAEVLGVDPWRAVAGIEKVELDEALARARAVSLNCSLTPSSRGLFDRRRLRRLQPGAVLVNTARGELLDVAAAVELVRSGRLGGLSVDVFPEEPWSQLAQHSAVPGVRLSPHASGYTAGLGEAVARGVVESVRCWLRAGRLPHQVLPPAESD